MRRYKLPFNGGRYVLNKATGEIHDLDNETPQCKIDIMDADNVYNCPTYQDAQIHAIFVENCGNPNGCYYCNPSKDNG